MNIQEKQEIDKRTYHFCSLLIMGIITLVTVASLCYLAVRNNTVYIANATQYHKEI